MLRVAMPRHRARAPSVHDLDALAAIYREVEAALAGWTCDLSTDCCHFGRTGREPQLWPNEWAMVSRALAARGGRRSLPIVSEGRAGRDDEGRCPLLGAGDRCTIYDARPFGCRTYFCTRAVGPARRVPRDTLAVLGRRVADLAQRADPHSDGPRPLRRWLEDR